MWSQVLSKKHSSISIIKHTVQCNYSQHELILGSNIKYQIWKKQSKSRLIITGRSAFFWGLLLRRVWSLYALAKCILWAFMLVLRIFKGILQVDTGTLQETPTQSYLPVLLHTLGPPPLHSVMQDQCLEDNGNVPWHERSSISSLKPLWQPHSKLPMVFLQKCSQPPLWNSHSSMSWKNNTQQHFSHELQSSWMF